MQVVVADTLLISDIHLGSELSRAAEARRLLKQASYRRLVLLGDIFCDLNFRRLKKEDWAFLSYIRKLSNPKRGIEVVWVEGNHDHGLVEVMSHLVGVRAYREYSWSDRFHRYVAVHGHQFDRFLINNALLSRVGEFVYLHLQRFDREGNPFSRWLDRVNSQWLRLTPKVAAGALAHARARGADVIFCGHTHEALRLEREGILYVNTGCWTHHHPTFVTVTNGKVELHYFVNEETLSSEVLEDRDEKMLLPEPDLEIA